MQREGEECGIGFCSAERPACRDDVHVHAQREQLGMPDRGLVTHHGDVEAASTQPCQRG
jgi:hypothetical protein